MAMSEGQQMSLRKVVAQAAHNLAALSEHLGTEAETIDWLKKAIFEWERTNWLAKSGLLGIRGADGIIGDFERLITLLMRANRKREAYSVTELYNSSNGSLLLSRGQARQVAASYPIHRRSRDEISNRVERGRLKAYVQPENQMPSYVRSIDEFAGLLMGGEESFSGEDSGDANYRESESASIPMNGQTSDEDIVDGDVAVLSYFVGENQAFLFVATRDTLEAFPLATTRGRIRTLIKRVGSFIDSSPVESAVLLNRPYFKKATAETLLTVLLAPAFGILPSVKRLIIIRGHDLGSLPFEMLPSTLLGNFSLPEPKPRFLIEEYEISYRYSAKLQQPNTNPKDASQPFLFALGCSTMPVPSNVSNTASAVRKSPSKPTDDEVLPEIISELKWLKSEFGDLAVAAIDGAASKEVFLKHAERSAIIHIASHSRACNQHRESGSIMLSPAQRNEALDSLSVLDVLKMKTSAKLVVLSSCRTATPFEAYSRIDFVKSFLIAGAGSVIASEWDVDDESTLKLMKVFYTHLKTGERKSKALQDAKKELIAAGMCNPYYWASFILVGDEREIAFPTKSKIPASISWGYRRRCHLHSLRDRICS